MHINFLNLGELSLEIRSLAQRARKGKLSPEEYKGGSFTISNLGMFGISDFQAILNPPQAAILAISGIQEVPIIKNHVVVPGKTLNLTLSVDHRVIDGVATPIPTNPKENIRKSSRASGAMRIIPLWKLSDCVILN